MSGHSKWSKVKHQKATTDVAKAAAFTKASRGITIAVKEGNGITDPSMNFHLRLAIEKARSVNMPKENIERAIDKAKRGDGVIIHQVFYEGYGPFGIAFFIEAVTDNMNRTVSFVKQILEHAGGSMGTPGSVSYLFTHRGVILIPKSVSYDTILEYGLEAGADDIIEREDVFEIYTEPSSLFQVKTNLEQKGLCIDTASLIMQPTMPIVLSHQKAEIIEKLVEQLEMHDDIEQVFTTIG